MTNMLLTYPLTFNVFIAIVTTKKKKIQLLNTADSKMYYFRLKVLMFLHPHSILQETIMHVILQI